MMPDASIDMIFADPPYGHRNNDGDLISKREQALGRGAAGPPRPIANDGAEANALARFLFGAAARLLARGGCCCCCCAGGGPESQSDRWSLWMDDHLAFKQMVIWDKGPMGMGWHYRRSYETVLVASKPGGPCKWHDESGRIENIIRPGAFGIRKIIPAADDHPTPKPWQLAAHFIRLHSLAGETILDPFMGSGTTGVACARMGRRFIGIEIEPKYFDMACRRIREAQRQADLFVEASAEAPTAEQGEMF